MNAPLKNTIRVGVLIGLGALAWKSGAVDNGLETLKTNPERNLVGAVAKYTTQPEPHQIKEAGIQSIDIFLQNNKANRLNARRDTGVFATNPQLFGKDAPFRPLVTIQALGPGTIFIQGGGPTGEITVPIPPALGYLQTIEIYPDFKLDLLLRETPTQENLKVWFEPARGRKTLQNETTIEWSQPNEVFLSNTSLCDLAALLTPSPTQGPPIKDASPTEILAELSQEIADLLLDHDTKSNQTGWQVIRTPLLMQAHGKANCLDLSLLTAQRAINHNLTPHLLVSTGHALCAVSLKGESAEKAVYFEATNFLVQPGSIPANRPRPQRPIIPGIKPEPPTDPTKPKITPPPPKKEDTAFYQIQLEKWIDLYRR